MKEAVVIGVTAGMAAATTLVVVGGVGMMALGRLARSEFAKTAAAVAEAAVAQERLNAAQRAAQP
jgi:hypothetical protein